MILLNFSLFRFLMSVFARRRQELRIRALLFVAGLGFVVLLPFAYPDEEFVHTPLDISDSCSSLTFVLQIVVLARDIKKKMHLTTTARLGHIAELLVVAGVALLVGKSVGLVIPEAAGMDVLEEIEHPLQYVTLVFVVIFRFYFLGTARGWAAIWNNQKLELVFYALLATHMVPFVVLESVTELEWHPIQALWLRIAIALSLIDDSSAAREPRIQRYRENYSCKVADNGVAQLRCELPTMQ